MQNQRLARAERPQIRPLLLKLGMKHWALAAAAAAALALAGCGGGGSTPKTSMQQEASPAEKQMMAVMSAVEAARNALDMINVDSVPTQDQIDDAAAAIGMAERAIEDADALTGEALAEYEEAVEDYQAVLALARTALAEQQSVAAAEADKRAAEEEAARLQAELDAKKAEEDAAALKAMNAMAKKIHSGLAGNFAADANDRPSATAAITAGKLTVTYDPDGSSGSTASSTVTGFEAVETDALSGWNGVDYQKKSGGNTYHAVVYNNAGPNTGQDFVKKYGAGGATDYLETDGFLSQTDLTTLADNLVAGDGFATGAGDKPHTEDNGQEVSVRGTFDGAPGTYACTQTAGTACESSVSAGGIDLTGGWKFTPDAKAKTSVPDGDYVRFGWWAHDDGSKVTVDAFTGVQGSPAVSGTFTALEGKATYKGSATGKAAVYDSLRNDNMGGVFTADATLSASFGNATDSGTLSGRIDNFSLEGEAVDWTVSLKETTLSSTGATPTLGTIPMTQWTINGVKGNDAGAWNATLYESDKDSDVPMAAAGEFTAAHTMSAHSTTGGRMVGAFGATKQ